MIVKVLSRHSASYGQLIDYMFKNDKTFTPLITQNIRGDKDAWLKEYLDNEAKRKYPRVKNVMLTHEILSFHNNSTEHLTDEKLKAIARQYAQSRNPNALVIASIHRDTEHTHIHCMVSGTEYASGYSSRMSKGRFAELKQEIQKVQETEFPELSDSLVEHGKGISQMTDKEYQTKLRTNANLRKEEIAMKINDAYAKATSRSEFVSFLQQDAIEAYSRAGKELYGVMCNGEKFRMSSLDFDTEANLKQLDAIEEDLKALEAMRNPEPEKEIEQSNRLKPFEGMQQLENAIEFPQETGAELPDISQDGLGISEER